MTAFAEHALHLAIAATPLFAIAALVTVVVHREHWKEIWR